MKIWQKKDTSLKKIEEMKNKKDKKEKKKGNKRDNVAIQ